MAATTASILADAPKPAKPRWYVPTPAKFLFAVLVMQGVLFLSAHYRWFWFNERKGWTVLITVAATVMALLLLVAAVVVSRFFKAKSQFSLATLLLMVPVMAIPCAWLGREYQAAERQEMLLVEGIRRGFSLSGDSRAGSELDVLPPAIQEFLLSTLGHGFFSDVTTIDVFKRVDDHDIELIEQFPRLESVVLFQAKITNEGMARLGKHAALRVLILNQIPAHEGASRLDDAAFARLALLTELRMLYLHNSGLTDAGVEHIVGLSNLEDVSITGAEITDKGLERLQGLPRLKTLTLQRTFKVTRAGLERFRAAMPNCKVLE